MISRGTRTEPVADVFVGLRIGVIVLELADALEQLCPEHVVERTALLIDVVDVGRSVGHEHARCDVAVADDVKVAVRPAGGNAAA